jgi:hypothetical protein
MIPLHETADDARAYQRDQRAAALAKRLCELLLRATGAWGFSVRAAETIAAERAREREHSLEHFARIVRAARDPSRLFARPDWQPTERLRAVVEQRGLTWAEVEARAAEHA